MLRRKLLTHVVMPGVAVLGWSAWAYDAAAQDASILSGNAVTLDRPALTLANSSVFFQKPEPPPTLKIHDTLTVLVKISTIMTSEGDVESRKKANMSAVLSDWIRLDLRTPALFPDPQRRGDPKIASQYDSQYRAESDMESRDRMTFQLAVEVVDIRPNGNLVIQGQRTVYNNAERWLLQLDGEVNRSDIDDSKTVTDDKIINLEIRKSESGQVRDGYRRGWFQRFLDRYQPI